MHWCSYATHKKKEKQKKKKSLGARQKRPLTVAPVREGLQGICKQINTQTRRPLTEDAHICSQAMLLILAIGASDKSAFCKRQYQSTICLLYKRRSQVTPSYKGKHTRL